ncbi:MAG: hypothetical protein L6R37_001944 [Teloschistes peruensis]|nr:MAG: hypothetical protein L6R37_001944 [Teloschistes peruensis]
MAVPVPFITPGRWAHHLAMVLLLQVRLLTPVPSTPRSVNPTYPGGAPQPGPEPQPLDGFSHPSGLHAPRSYPSRDRSYLHSPSYGAADALTQKMGQLSTAGPAYHPLPQKRVSMPQDSGYSAQNVIEPLPSYEDEVPPSSKHAPGAKLDFRYRVMSRPHEYFVEGTVFIKLHTEEAGSTSASDTFGFSTVAYDGRVYSQLRRFVVVKPRPREFYCLCVGKGTMKKGVDKNAHTIIYTGDRVPQKLSGEREMRKAPLRVIPDGPEEMLDPMSRINLGKPYPVEWNNRVKPIGRLDSASRVQLMAYWKSLVNAS